MLQGCIHKLVTVPVKVAYKTTKGVVKGTAAVVGAVIPDGDDEKQKDNGEDKDWLCLEKLPILKVPTLIVWNRYDPYYPLSGALKAKELIPNARLEVFPGCGHAPHVKNRDFFNNLLLSFIDHD